MEWFEGRLEIIRRKKIRNIIILISLKMNKKPPCSTLTPHEEEDKATIVASLLFQQKFILQRKKMKYFLKLFDLKNRILSSKQETFSGCEGKDAREIYFTLLFFFFFFFFSEDLCLTIFCRQSVLSTAPNTCLLLFSVSETASLSSHLSHQLFSSDQSLEMAMDF
jgi:hypothetical protein